ncbi:hypothetical protein BOTBODRAFT_186171 [Botryobasidium botryosum FD-172 SS1]|uniref:Uncharacterized protein n=1 Tax=Botryobasidium botryosum (strain FD-172 SS1) TaxID=930990 RepID=A0A067MZM8_BOTB1|nr:hypothetical protein BOTBODRAFT_186171 [Botryobasidium botryosum FD-172 SS1]
MSFLYVMDLPLNVATGETHAVLNDSPGCQRLPAETLLEIFKTYRQLTCSDTSAILSVSHVCVQWRNVIQACSVFWADLELYLRSKEVDLQAAYWLARSGTRPLRIKIHCPVTPWEEDIARHVEERLGRLFPLLVDTVGRWEFVAATLPRCQAFFHLRNWSAHAPKLRSFSLRVVNGTASGLSAMRRVVEAQARAEMGQPAAQGGDATTEMTEEPPGILTWRQAHNTLMLLPVPFEGVQDRTLATGASVRVSLEGILPTFGSFGQNVTELSVETKSKMPFLADAVIEMFRACPNLVQVRLACPGIIGELSPHRASAALPCLAHLAIDGPPQVTPLLSCMVMPMLRSLHIHGFDCPDDFPPVLQRILADAWDTLVEVVLSALLKPVEPFGFDEEEALLLPAMQRFLVHASSPLLPLLSRISLPNVTQLDISNAPFDVARRLLSTPRQVKAVSFAGIVECPDSPQNVLLPTVTSLSVIRSPDLLDHIRAPNATSLVFGNLHWEDPPVSLMASLPEAVELAQLRTVHLVDMIVGDDEIVELLKLLPSVGSLSLSRCFVSDHFLAELSKPLSEPPFQWLCPRLTSIQLESNLHITPTGVIEFLQVRGPKVIPRETSSPPPSRVKCRATFERSVKVGPPEWRKIVVSLGLFGTL